MSFLHSHPRVKEFLATIKADPFNPGVQFVFADWLEENGHVKAASRHRHYASLLENASPKFKQTPNKPNANWIGMFLVGNRCFFIMTNGKIRDKIVFIKHKPTPIGTKRRQAQRACKLRQQQHADRMYQNDYPW